MATPVVFLSYKRALLAGAGADLEGVGAVKVALIDDTLSPSVTSHTEWSDLSANEVSGTGYTAGGVAVANPSIADATNNATYTHDDVEWSQDGAGFSDARYAVWYFASTGDLIAYMDLGGDVGNVSGPLKLDVGAGGVISIQ